MKLSNYMKMFPAKDKESLIFFSTRRASAVLVPSGLVDDIKKGSLTEEERETLSDLGFLVPDQEAEKQEMISFVRELNEEHKCFTFIIVLNLDCNLGCRYCFEGTRKGKFFMSDETGDQLIGFIRNINFENKNEIRTVFYGGEPLLSTERIVSLASQIGSLAEKKGLAHSFSLVTNGTLLTPAVVKQLVPYGLKSAKVTFDGPEDVHNRFRPFKSGRGSYDVIMRNIRDVCRMIQVQIGGNYTKEHYQAFPLLLDDLLDKGLGPDRIAGVKFDPVVNESSEFALSDFHDGCNSLGEQWMIDASISLRQEILRRGYRTRSIMPSVCAIEFSDSLVINQDGTLYKCPGLIGRKEYCTGTLKSGTIDVRQSHAVDRWKNKECLACSYLPLCFGGCRYMTVIRDGNMESLDCRKEYFDKALHQFVLQDIEYNL